ncbi:alpha/beta hydrolase [Streptacidiphilus sp. EB129]|uniref:alpha/beta hydrolase n=1 Tax=Streptacidiphilus sp. EB129 TaxID=3156262 RepID=UPI0035110667
MRPTIARRRQSLVSAAAAALLALPLAACGGSSSPAPRTPSQDLGGSGKPTASASASTAAPGPTSTVVSMPAGPKTPMTVSQNTSVGPIYVTTLHGAKSGVSGKVWVWLPPQYNDPRYANYGFPVVTMYSGGSSAGYNTWNDQKQLGIQAKDVELAQQGKASPFIMIMPIQNFHDSDFAIQDCSDIPGQPKMATWMGEDIPDFVRANFRTLQSRDGWGLMGASTGGFCSAKLALQFPQTFKAAVPIDGYFIPDSWYWKGHDPEKAANNPMLMVPKNTTELYMLLTVGGREANEQQEAGDFIKAGKASPQLHTSYYVLPHGDHLTSDFKKVIPMTLEFLSQHLMPPTAG